MTSIEYLLKRNWQNLNKIILIVTQEVNMCDMCSKKTVVDPIGNINTK